MKHHSLAPRALAAAVISVVAAIGAPLCLGAEATQTQAPLPPNAVVLFDGKGAKPWVQAGTKKPCAWTLGDGYLEAKKGDVATTQTFRDCQLHLEFWLPKLPDSVTGEKRANSGVFLQGLYEVQILDSYGKTALTEADCAAICERKAPQQSAAMPPEQWQSYDIIFRAPRFAGKKMVKKPRLTLFWNNVMAQNDVEIDRPTRGNAGGDPKAPGPVMLQGLGSPVRFRNIWVVPLKSE